jgi:hypothetical protein
MGLILLLILSCFFGYVFSEHKNRKVEQLQIKLSAAEAELVKIKEQHEFEKRIWKRTVEELL